MLGRRMICFDMSDAFCNVLNQFVALVSSIIMNGHLLPYLSSMGGTQVAVKEPPGATTRRVAPSVGRVGAAPVPHIWIPWFWICFKYVFRLRIYAVNDVLHISILNFCSPKFWVSNFKISNIQTLIFLGKRNSFRSPYVFTYFQISIFQPTLNNSN